MCQFQRCMWLHGHEQPTQTLALKYDVLHYKLALGHHKLDFNR